MKRAYGYGIVDRDGKPWWDEGCVCQDLGPLRETAAMLNDKLEMNSPEDEARTPFRVVRLFWQSKGRRK